MEHKILKSGKRKQEYELSQVTNAPNKQYKPDSIVKFIGPMIKNWYSETAIKFYFKIPPLPWPIELISMKVDWADTPSDQQPDSFLTARLVRTIEEEDIIITEIDPFGVVPHTRLLKTSQRTFKDEDIVTKARTGDVIEIWWNVGTKGDNFYVQSFQVTIKKSSKPEVDHSWMTLPVPSYESIHSVLSNKYLLQHIFSFLDMQEGVRAKRVNSQFRSNLLQYEHFRLPTLYQVIGPLDDKPVLHYQTQPLSSPLREIFLSVDWIDQGWGNNKGCISLRLVRPTNDKEGIEPEVVAHFDYPLGFAQHYPTTVSKTFRKSDVVTKSRKGDVLQVLRNVGDGGGHTLTISRLLLVTGVSSDASIKTV